MAANKAASGSALALTGAFVLGAGASFLLHYFQNKRRQGDNRDELLPAPRRFGAAILLKRDQYQRYRELHDNCWDQVLERMSQSNIRNFVIYYHDSSATLFQSFEWIGHWKAGAALSKEEEQIVFENDMKAIADDPITRKWWVECEPCQTPFTKSNGPPPSMGGSDEWWAPLECVCHTGHWPTAYSDQRRDPDFVKLA